MPHYTALGRLNALCRRMVTLASFFTLLLSAAANSQTFEAELASFSGARVDADRDRPFSGSGFVNYTATVDGRIEWQLPIAASGRYRLSWRYQLASGSRPLAFRVDGALMADGPSFPANGSWTSWADSHIELDLSAGTRRVSLSTTGQEGPNIDFLTLTSLQPQSFYEAESGQLSGARVDRDADRPFSGSGFVNFTQLSGGSVTWTVTVAETGSYDLLWQYQMATGPRPLDLRVNGVLVGQFNAPVNGTWTQWASAHTSAVLRAGSNSISLTTTGSEGPNIDWLRLQSSRPLDTSRLRINFSDAATPVPSGWLRDSGEAYGLRSNGYTYGWRADASGAPTSLAAVARNRPPSPDVNVLRETLIHMNHPSSNATHTWEVALPNGEYRVIAQVGDSNNEGEIRSDHQLLIEGATGLLSTFTRLQGEFGTLTQGLTHVEHWVTVRDGALSIGTVSGSNTKINFVVIESVASDRPLTPYVAGSTPRDGDVDVPLDTTISANFIDNLNVDEAGQSGVADASVNSQTVRLFELTSTGAAIAVAATTNTTGGSDAINLIPQQPLRATTRYRVVINGVTDATGAPLVPFSMEFITGTRASNSDPRWQHIGFQAKVDMLKPGRYTSLVMGPDQRLYALDLDGSITRWDLLPDGTLGTELIIRTLQQAHPEHIAVGLVFAPESTADNLIAYVSHATPFVKVGSGSLGAAWGGRISRLRGSLLEEETLLVTNLPRSTKDHLTNSIAMRADEPRVLYFNQGSNSAAGEADPNWGNRPERLLAGATLRLDLDRLPGILPLDARTTDDLLRINNDDRNLPLFSDGTYNPYAPEAPLTLYASGIRNAYDLVWHSNGFLYVPVNGTAGGGISPAAVATRRPDGQIIEWSNPVPRISGHGVQPDWLLRIDPAAPLRYHGHPNPLRGEFVLNRGHRDSTLIGEDIALDPNFEPPVYDFGFNKSPNGVIEYRNGEAHNGRLAGALLVTRYSNNNDIFVLVPDADNGSIVSTSEGIVLPGLTGFRDPLDLVEDPRNGNLYVSDQIHPLDVPGKLYLLRPMPR